MRQFLPFNSLEETLSKLGLTEQNLDFVEATTPILLHPMEQKELFEAREKLHGGIGDGAKNADFDPEELAMGIEVEKEHTQDEKIAAEIARDHLSEIPDYYSRLKKMEKGAKTESVGSDGRPDYFVLEGDHLYGYYKASGVESFLKKGKVFVPSSEQADSLHYVAQKKKQEV